MSILKMFVRLIAVMSLVLLTACSLLSPVKVDPPTKYILSGVPNVPHKRMHRSTILVMTPESRPSYSTTQMAYSIHPYEIAYYSKNEWAETPEQMFSPLIVQTLQNSHAFHAVMGSPYTGRYDYALNTQILELLQDFNQKPAVLRLTVRAALMNANLNKVTATHVVHVTVPMLNNSPDGGVFAANRAAQEVLRQLALFCLYNVK